MALQGANNETGVIQPVAEAAALVHAAGGFLFCDAVQMAGRTACDIAALGADALMLSAHKMGGLKGAGALVAARAGISLGAPLMRGGGQERGGRAGTESVATIAAFGAAARACLAELDGEPARLTRAARSPDDALSVRSPPMRWSLPRPRRDCPTPSASLFPASRPRR